MMIGGITRPAPRLVQATGLGCPRCGQPLAVTAQFVSCHDCKIVTLAEGSSPVEIRVDKRAGQPFIVQPGQWTELA